MIDPPRPLRLKVGQGKGMDVKVLNRAEKAVETLLTQTNYPGEASKTLVKLKSALDELLAETDNQNKHLHRIFEIVHDMRGEAGSFGYPLVTRVGASLCRYIDKIKPMDGKNLRVVRVHVDALRAMVRANAKGTGPRIAQEIAKSLELVVQIHTEQYEREHVAKAANDDGFQPGLVGQ
jgi:HPt (histidine-containing phosphotransfer) domain-containing protein